MKTFLILLFFISFNAAGKIVPKLFVNGSETTKSIPAGLPVNIEVYAINEVTNKPVTNYKKMHAKFMHMVIVNHQRSIFKHVHPYFDPGTGRFSIALNVPHQSFDNQDAKDALSVPGEYHLVFEVEIKNVGMRMFKFPLTVEGTRTGNVLSLDNRSQPNRVHKYFNADGSLGIFNAQYEGTLTMNTLQGCSGNILKFDLLVKEYVEDSGYQNITKLMPWLMMGGHGLLLKENDGKAKHFAHMHASFPLFGNPFEFNHFDRFQLTKGKYILWVQFNHDKKLVTVPFTFEYTPKAKRSDCK